MSEKKIEIARPNLPLEPIVGESDTEYSEIKAAHDALLAEMMKELAHTQDFSKRMKKKLQGNGF